MIKSLTFLLTGVALVACAGLPSQASATNICPPATTFVTLESMDNNGSGIPNIVKATTDDNVTQTWDLKLIAGSPVVVHCYTTQSPPVEVPQANAVPATAHQCTWKGTMSCD